MFWNRNKEPKVNYRQQAINRLKAFKKIGDKFNYLGVDMIVTAHSELRLSPIGADVIPVLVCDYKDLLGKIQVVRFSPHELPALEAENPNQ